MYKIRGRHSTVYPVQLPNWICPDIVDKLIGRFDNYLREELLTMWSKHHLKEKKLYFSEQLERKSGHSNHPSLQSVSSGITDTSIFSDETDLNDLKSRTDQLSSYLPEADDRASNGE
jgi:hypothetical protein